MTPSGFVPVYEVHKTIPYSIWILKFSDGKELRCADTHILIDSFGNQIYAKDSLGSWIKTIEGDAEVTSVEDSGVEESMYDISIASLDGLYYSNGVLSHNTTILSVVILHYIIFNDNKTVVVLANKGATSKEILRRIKLAYENLPKWLQHGIREWNKESFELENGSRVIAGTTTSDSVRGISASMVLVDEASHIDGHLWEEFQQSTFPVLSSGKDTRMFLISTPNSLNHFYKIYKDGLDGKNNFNAMLFTWRAVPSRDQEWYENEVKTLGSLRKFQQEHECEFLGSSLTLLPPDVLGTLAADTPIATDSDGFLRVYKKPVADHTYIAVADPSEGVGGDNSAISVIDISTTPFEQVAAFSDNSQNTISFSGIIDQIGRNYNNAYVMVESNNYAGGQVVKILEDDLDYPNLLRTTINPKGMDFGLVGNAVGIRTNQATKGLGCAMIKLLLEKGILRVCDQQTIDEFSTFIVSSTSKKGYEAQSGSTDDLVMTLVIFAWMTDQPFFKELTTANVRATIGDGYGDSKDSTFRSAGLVIMTEVPLDNFGWNHLDAVDTYDEHMDTLKWMMGR